MLAGGTSYPCIITVENIGTINASACNYQITGDEGELYNGILGSIAPGKTQKIDITLKCGSITEEKRFKKLNLVINDPISKKTWNDSVSFLFYKETLTITVMRHLGGNLMQGIVISPEHKSYFFDGISTSNPYKFIVPRLRGNYLLTFVPYVSRYNAGQYLYLDEEIVYGIDSSSFPTHMTTTEFNKKVASFTDTGAYEPNDTESSAALITEPIIAYFHKGDLDYYVVSVF
jgi:hypothetical protein